MGGHEGVGVSIDTPTPMHPLRPKNSKKKKREKEKLFFFKKNKILPFSPSLLGFIYITIYYIRCLICSHLVRKQKKKHLQETRKCLIISVDQPGLEPGTSRL